MPFLTLQIRGLADARARLAAWNSLTFAAQVSAPAGAMLIDWLQTFIRSVSRAQGRDFRPLFDGRDVVIVSNLIEYFIETGTRRHLIPGNPFLSFDWQGKHWILRSVNHPGTRATEYVEWASQAFRTPFLELARNEAAAMLGAP